MQAHKAPAPQNTLLAKIDTEFQYYGNHIVKIWEQYLKKELKVKFYCTENNNAPNTRSSLFAVENSLSQDREVGLVLKSDGTPYKNHNNNTITLSGTVKHAQNPEDASSVSWLNNINTAISQIKNYNSNKENKAKIDKHTVIFPYHTPGHWSLGRLNLTFTKNDDVSKINAEAMLYNPLGNSDNSGSFSKDFCSKLYDENKNIQLTIKLPDIKHEKQQYDSTSCGPITAENGKWFLAKDGSVQDFLKITYLEEDAKNLRLQQLQEVYGDTPSNAQFAAWRSRS